MTDQQEQEQHDQKMASLQFLHSQELGEKRSWHMSPYWTRFSDRVPFHRNNLSKETAHDCISNRLH